MRGGASAVVGGESFTCEDFKIVMHYVYIFYNLYFMESRNGGKGEEEDIGSSGERLVFVIRYVYIRLNI